MNPVCSSLSAGALLLAFTAVSPASHAQQRPDGVLPPGTRELRDTAYVPNGHERQKLDLYLPAKSDKPLPVVIFVHGGAWKAGSKDRCPATRFLREGFAVASLNYRLSQHAVFPAQIEDCKAAVRWLRAHAKDYNLDSDRFGAWGTSAGGHLVAMLGVTADIKDFDTGPNLDYSSRVQAVVDYFGPTDLLRMGAQSGPASQIRHDAADSPESQLIGGAVQENKDKAKRASPITYVSKEDAPMLLVHGDNDPLVPCQQSETMHEALRKVGVESELRIVKGAGHGNGFGAGESAAVKTFLEKWLRKE